MMSQDRWAVMLALSGVALPLGSAQAATSTAADAAAGDQLQEVIVTASRRSETIKEVPTSVSVLSGAELAQQNVADFTDLTRAVPGMSFTNSGGSGLNNIEIRGISSGAGSGTVGIYLDDVPVTVRNATTEGSTEPKFFDVERVEVLRGPQGTLFGASSMGGTIRYITAPANLTEYKGSASAELGYTNPHGGVNYSGQLALSVPVLPGIAALRFGAMLREDSGWVDRVSATSGAVLNPRSNSERTTAARVRLDLRVSQSVQITPAVYYQRVVAGDSSVFDLDLPQFQTSKLLRETGSDQIVVPSLTVKADLSWAELVSVTSFFDREFDRLGDGTFFNSVYVGDILQQQLGFGGDAIGALVSPVHNNTTNTQFSQELRLASKSMEQTGGKYSYIAGLFYAHGRQRIYDNEFVPGFNAAISSVYGSTPEALLGSAFSNDNIFFANDVLTEEQSSVFVDGTVAPVRALKLSAGVRYLIARQAEYRVGDGYFNGGPSFNDERSRSHALTPRFAAVYDLTPASTVYANISKGFRLGGPNQVIPPGPCASDLAALGLTGAPPSYRSDSLWSYELGAKTDLLNRRLSINADVYYIKWNEIQQDINLPTCGFTFTGNVGKARSYGTELELKAKPINGVTLATAFGYTRATLTQGVPFIANEGQEILGVPRWTANGSAEYARPIFGGGALATARVNYQAVSSSHGSYQVTDPDYERPSYGLLGGSLGIEQGPISYRAYVTNLLDEDKVIQHPNINSVQRGYGLRPRTIGLSVSARF